MNESLHVSGGRTVLRVERRMRHRPEKVWRAITEPEHLNQWFPFNVEVELRLGAKMRFLEQQPDGGPATFGEVTEVDPPRVFAFTWGDNDALRFELRPDGDGCVLTFTHAFADHFGAASFTTGWQVCLDALEAALAGRPIEPPGDMAETHDAYVVRFGLDEGSVEGSDEGWRVRFERQMTRPNETVWAVLTARETPEIAGQVPSGFTTGEIAAGPVTAVDESFVLEYDWLVDGRPGGRVRWELGPGTGQGGRLVLTQTGPNELADAKATALTAWKTRIDQLATQLREAASP